MKKFLLTVTLLTLLLTLTKPVYADKTCTCGNPYCAYSTTTEVKARKKVKAYVKKYYAKGRYKNFAIKFISPDKLTYKKLVNRKKNKIIYIEVSDGFVMDGNTYAGLTIDGYYISYEGIDDTLPKGTRIRTYCLYNPENNYEDDIIYRTDRVLNTKRNCKPIRKAEKKFKKHFKVSYKEEILKD